jgi:hypothetical protein
VEAQRILYAAKRFERIQRAPGSRNGPLGSVALEVLELFVNLVEYRTGRLEPALETIARLVRRSKDAVVRALAALRRHGFLDWLRRYVPADRKDGAGPQVQQTSNAYRMSLPARAAALVGRWFSPPPPADDAHRRATATAEAQAMIEALPLFEQGTAALGSDSALGAVLDRLGAAVMERESAKRSESPARFNP